MLVYPVEGYSKLDSLKSLVPTLHTTSSLGFLTPIILSTQSSSIEGVSMPVLNFSVVGFGLTLNIV
jgi:hypothetical protein